MSNEYYDWLDDIACEKAIRNTAKNIYDYTYKMFFEQSSEQQNFRANYGFKGAASQVLSYIWNNFIEPYEEGDEV